MCIFSLLGIEFYIYQQLELANDVIQLFYISAYFCLHQSVCEKSVLKSLTIIYLFIFSGSFVNSCCIYFKAMLLVFLCSWCLHFFFLYYVSLCLLCFSSWVLFCQISKLPPWYFLCFRFARCTFSYSFILNILKRVFLWSVSLAWNMLLEKKI